MSSSFYHTESTQLGHMRICCSDLATTWMTEGSLFCSHQEQGRFLIQSIQTGCKTIQL